MSSIEKNKIEKTIKHLINYQLKKHNLQYEDIVGIDDWYLKYSCSLEEQDELLEYATNYIAKELKMSKKLARKEANWFILNWGLKTETKEEIRIKIK